MTTTRPEPPQALVVGGAKRVGRAIALTLAGAGCNVDITYNHSRAEADDTARQVRARNRECATWSLPLDDPRAAASAALPIAGSRPRWDIVVLCASSYAQTPFETLASDEVTSILAVNAASPALVLREFLPGLRRSTLDGGGCVVAMCDIHAMGESGRPRKGYLAYSMSKAALLEMTLVLARELAPRIRVNAVAPGVVAWPESGPDSNPAEQAKYLGRIPLGRAGTPQDAAEAVAWLALKATYCTGQVIRIDGGRSLT